ncbi:hypothetical protein J4439_05425 [Candidatus Woesearchaeota archaeon]|nr:hypothetical protein [Candidatus Woesearchaeota archaeon]
MAQEELSRLHTQLLELKASLREAELRHEALLCALEKNGILISQEVESELQRLLDELREKQDAL